MSNERYNGWINYETWSVALWVDNDQGAQEYWRGRAVQCWEGAERDKYRTRQDVATRVLAQELQDEIRDSNPLASVSSMYSDILSAALSDVNWDEIARHWIDDIAD